MIRFNRKPAKNVHDRVRTFFNTYPQCSLSKEAVLEHYEKIGLLQSELYEYVIAEEEHADGTPHLHVYAKFGHGIAPGKELANWRAMFDIPKDGDVATTGEKYHGNYQAVRSADAVRKYCTKDDNFITNMNDKYVLCPKQKRRKFAIQLETRTVADLVREGEISYQSARAAQYAKDLLAAQPYDHDTVRGTWVHGVPGSGKSHYARTNFPGFYLKNQTKWFDGYNGQEAIVLEDFDCKSMGHELKIWADRWSCYGETKGGHVHLRHKHFVITSNYSIEDLFGHDEALCEAIKRRFPTVIRYAFKYQG